jgi:hypothetical protein
MSRLQRYRGHFYNWYDTRDLRALEPRYVSSVDSGNLAAHLIAVANSAREWTSSPLTARQAAAGALDALSLAQQALRDLPVQQRSQSIMWRQIDEHFPLRRPRWRPGGAARRNPAHRPEAAWRLRARWSDAGPACRPHIGPMRYIAASSWRPTSRTSRIDTFSAPAALKPRAFAES